MKSHKNKRLFIPIDCAVDEMEMELRAYPLLPPLSVFYLGGKCESNAMVLKVKSRKEFDQEHYSQDRTLVRILFQTLAPMSVNHTVAFVRKVAGIPEQIVLRFQPINSSTDQESYMGQFSPVELTASTDPIRVL